MAKARLGVHGLRAHGVRTTPRGSRSQGARLRKTTAGVATPKSPLEGVLSRLEKWFKREREHGHEVKRKTILTRLTHELEFERDKQQTLCSLGHKDFNPEVLSRATKRLKTLSIFSASARTTAGSSTESCRGSTRAATRASACTRSRARP